MLGFPWLAGMVGPVSPRATAVLDQLATTRLDLGAGPGDAEAQPARDAVLWGSWRPGELRTVAAGPDRAIFLGQAWFTDEQGEHALAKARHRGDYHEVARLPGSHHAAVITRGAVHLYPDGIGLRRFWYARSTDGLLFATHALVLQAALGAPVDDDWLAARLAASSLRDVWDSRGPFVGVHPVPPASMVALSVDLSVRQAPMWSPPEADVPLAEAAGELRATLAGAVDQRLRGVRRASYDLSGGLDSGSLAFLAERAAADGGTSLVAITRRPVSPANDDPLWTGRAAADLHSRHVLLDVETDALPYAGIDSAPLLDEPDPSTLLVGPMRQSAGWLGAWGSELHLAGNGGDQVLGAPLTYLRRLVRSRPDLAVRHLRGQRALHGLSRAALADLVRPGTYSHWLARVADTLGTAQRTPPTWAAPPGPPAELLRREVVDAARRIVAESVPPAAAVGDDIERHGPLIRLRQCAGKQRIHRDAAASMGLRVELPYLDPQVVEVCLSTRPHERMDPYRPKPLLVEAMRGIVPDQVLCRTTMGVYDAELHLGWRRHRADVAQALEDSLLVEQGLVHGAALRDALTRSHDTAGLIELNEVLAVESWLRSLADWRSDLARATLR